MRNFSLRNWISGKIIKAGFCRRTSSGSWVNGRSFCSGYFSRICAKSNPGIVAQGCGLTNRASKIASTIGHGVMRIGSRSGIGMGKASLMTCNVVELTALSGVPFIFPRFKRGSPTESNEIFQPAPCHRLRAYLKTPRRSVVAEKAAWRGAARKRTRSGLRPIPPHIFLLLHSAKCNHG